MKQFYANNSIKIITGTLAVVLIGMYIWLTVFTQNAHLTNPVYTRDLVEKVEFKNFIGTIELNTSEEDGFKLEFSNKKADDIAGYYPLFKMGTPTIATIDGRFAPIEACDIKHDQDNLLQTASITEEGGQTYDIKTYPIVKITAKHDIILDIRRSNAFGFAANIGGAKFINVNCSSLTVGKIANGAEFDMRGASMIVADDIGGDFSLKSTTIGDDGNTFILQNIQGNAIIATDGNTRLYAAEINGNLLSETTGENQIAIDNVVGTETKN